ncbi:hypothetical protein R3P38DRAFT_3282446 [Favolaschia claudopus]|uniref:DUF6534 domain-containing protein n=1 Tax=Favolaschia claudopus TaxID=2862362 RepID=A0AAW0ACY3_9AGAR
MSLRLGFSLPMPIVARGSLIPLDNTLGTWLIGLILSSVLYGITCLQVYLYFTKSCSRDRTILKTFVMGLFLLDTFHLSLVSHSMYSVVVTNFGDYVQLGIIPWSLLLQTAFGSFLSANVRLFYAWRIYIISNKFLLLPSVIGICSIPAFIFSVLYTQKGFEIKFFKLADRLFVRSALGLGFGAAADLLIAGTMIYYLSKNKTGFQKTNKAINMLVTYSLSTGALACVFALGDVIAVQFNSLSEAAAAPANLDQVPFFFILIRRKVFLHLSLRPLININRLVHALSFMSILNSREHVREQLYAGGHAMVTIPSYPPGSGIEYATNPDTKVDERRSIGLTNSRRLGPSTSKGSVV